MRKQKCRGYTLIELSITMSVGFSLLMLSVGLVHQVMRFHSISKQRAAEHQTFDRLSQDFRSSVHLAISANLKSATEITLTQADQTLIKYSTKQDAIRRQNIVDGKVKWQEIYQFARPILSTFATNQNPQQVSLTVSSAKESVGIQIRQSRQFNAVLGRRLDHEKGEVHQ
ncbi:hypothetical protein OAL35_01870 [bacterium]|nr:hypothetical protein [bacterium]